MFSWQLLIKLKTKTTEIIETVLPEVVVSEVKRLGRPVNENSVRQIRLKELEMKRINGELRRGRPVNESSVRQIRLKELEMKRANGELKKGRPKMNVVMEVVAE